MPKKFSSVLVVSLLILPSVFAQSDNIITEAFGKIYEILQNEDLVFALTFILCLILLYALFAAALGRMAVFGDNKLPNKLGRMIAITLSALICIGVFSFTGRESLVSFIGGQMALIGIPGALIFGLLIFAVAYASFKGKKGRSLAKALFVLGFALVVWGLLSESEEIASWGWVIILISLIIGFLKFFGSRGGSEPPPRGPRRRPPPERGPTPPQRPRRDLLRPFRWVLDRAAPHLRKLLEKAKKTEKKEKEREKKISYNIEQELQSTTNIKELLEKIKLFLENLLSQGGSFNTHNASKQVIGKLNEVKKRINQFEKPLRKVRERLERQQKKKIIGEDDTYNDLAQYIQKIIVDSRYKLSPTTMPYDQWKKCEEYADWLSKAIQNRNDAVRKLNAYIDQYDKEIKSGERQVDSIISLLQKDNLQGALKLLGTAVKRYDVSLRKLRWIRGRQMEIDKYNRAVGYEEKFNRIREGVLNLKDLRYVK